VGHHGGSGQLEMRYTTRGGHSTGSVKRTPKAMSEVTHVGGRGRASESGLAWAARCRQRDSRDRTPAQNRGGVGLEETVVLTLWPVERERMPWVHGVTVVDYPVSSCRPGPIGK
jgi:hypothetical protein